MTEETVEPTEELEVDEQINADELEVEQPEQEWMKPDESEPEAEYTVDGKLHQSMKSKLKGRVSARDEEIEKLRTENEALRLAGQQKVEPKLLTRPIENAFDTDEEYNLALSQYDGRLAQETYNRNQAQTNQEATRKQATEKLTEAIDSHYERAELLIKETGIKPENYKKADENLRRAFDTIRPKEGDLIVDQLISKLGKGSEKVAYFLGVNKPAQAKAQSLLTSDPSGMSLLVYLGEQKQRLINPTKPKSNAPDPATNLKGDVSASNTVAEKKLKTAYNKIGAGTTESYNIRKQAKEAGYDVSKW